METVEVLKHVEQENEMRQQRKKKEAAKRVLANTNGNPQQGCNRNEKN